MLRKFLLLFIAATLSAMPAVADDNPCDDQNIDIECVEYTREKAEQGDTRAQRKLAVMYSQGNGVVKDNYEALRWFLMAGDYGVAIGLDSMVGGYSEMIRLLRVLAEEGQAEAQWSLGNYVVEDKRRKVYWFRAAAEQGHPLAQFWLGVMYAGGEGVIKDYREAYIWYLIAAAGGHAPASFEAEDIVRREELSSQEIKSARREANKRMIKIETRRINR